jgi:hypothetical protein
MKKISKLNSRQKNWKRKMRSGVYQVVSLTLCMVILGIAIGCMQPMRSAARAEGFDPVSAGTTETPGPGSGGSSPSAAPPSAGGSAAPTEPTGGSAAPSAPTGGSAALT